MTIMASDRPPSLDRLADELISDILAFLLCADHPSSESSPASDHHPRANGFAATHGAPYGERSELDRFRLVCRRFMRIGTPRKFPRFVLRFSRDGFERLEELLRMQRACHVKYFTYMVRPFYQGSGWSALLQNPDDVEDKAASTIHRRRLHEQIEILERNQDQTLLRRALAAFTSLQQIKLLRLQDAADERLREHLREHPTHSAQSTPPAHRDWESACARAISSLSLALLESPCTGVRFVGPQICPDASLRLLHAPTPTLSALAARLTSLDITFHAQEDVDLTPKLATLSPVFDDFFRAATNLTAIHLGFPATRPLALSLEQVFHRVQWKRLRTLSLQGWRLTAEETIALLRRHRRPLRDLRLASIYLQPSTVSVPVDYYDHGHDRGGRGGGTGEGQWHDILRVLRDEMDHLERIDLRDLHYASATSFDNGDEEHDHRHNDHHHPNHHPYLHLNSSLSNGNNTNNHSHNSILPHLPPPDYSPRQTALHLDHALPFPPRGTTRQSFPAATLEQLRCLTVKDLGDNGVRVGRDQTVLWEAWVLSSPT